jgi:hypothetical protein
MEMGGFLLQVLIGNTLDTIDLSTCVHLAIGVATGEADRSRRGPVKINAPGAQTGHCTQRSGEFYEPSHPVLTRA